MTRVLMETTVNNESWKPFQSDSEGNLIPKPDLELEAGVYPPSIQELQHTRTGESIPVINELSFQERLELFYNLDTSKVEPPPYESPLPEPPISSPTITDIDIKDTFADFDNASVLDTVVIEPYRNTISEPTVTGKPSTLTVYPPIIVNSHLFKHVKSIEEKMARSPWVKKDWYIRPAQFVLTAIVFIPREIVGDGKII